jgi:hypothetical protein
MATRFYLSASGETVPITPSPLSNWENVSIMERVLCNTVKRGLAMTNVDFPSDGDSTNKDILFRQYISPILVAGQTITGSQSIKAQCRVLESSNFNNMFFTIGIYVYRGTGPVKFIFDPTIIRDNVEAATITLINRQFTAVSAVTNYTTIAGDRIIIEIGMGGDQDIDGDHESIMRLGDASATDLSEDNTSTTDNNPWVELSDTLTFVTQGQASRSMHQFRQRRI